MCLLHVSLKGSAQPPRRALTLRGVWARDCLALLLPQEDYHKLLTKYAEAENTIDQLRLGAKVNLYSDPPQPSHSIHRGTVSQGTKVLSFTIPQPHLVERLPGPSEALQASEASGWPSARGDLSPSSPSSMPTSGWLPENPSSAQDQPTVERTQMLASWASQFLAKVRGTPALSRGRLCPWRKRSLCLLE